MMREIVKIWIGAAAVVAIYLLLCSSIDAKQADIERCSVVRCT